MVIATVLTLTATARAATITVDSLADTGAPGICVLRDAITAANTMTATNGCAAGDGNDTIQFSVTGTISLASTLPQITDNNLAINGPTSPSITLDGGHKVQVMVVAPGATVKLSKLRIVHGFNSAFLSSGGGIGNAGTLTVINCTFSFNHSFTHGGAIYNNGTLTVANSSFYYNFAVSGFGGAIANFRFASQPSPVTATITNSAFSANSAGDGGGVYNGAMATITNSTFSANSALFGGGIENANGDAPGATLTITNSTFSANSASFGGGGGIENVTGIGGEMTLIVINSTFSANSSSIGGGIDNGGRLTVTNSTFSANTNSTIENFATASFKSTILVTSSNGVNCLNEFGTLTDVGYNISDDSSCGFSATSSLNNTDPQLDPAGLRNNGGPTKTIALLSGSPAIDAIPLADCTDQASPPNPIITDQRLFPRPDAEEHRCDIGAYEFADTPFVAFARFHGHLTIRANQTVFDLGGRFKLGTGGSIDPTTQPVAFSVGSYAIRLPVGSFVNYNSGYVYQKRVNGIFLWLFIKFSGTPDTYILRAYRRGGTIPGTGSPVPVTLTIGDNSGSTRMNAKFD